MQYSQKYCTNDRMQNYPWTVSFFHNILNRTCLTTSCNARLNSPPGAIPSCSVRCADRLRSKICTIPWIIPAWNINKTCAESWIKQQVNVTYIIQYKIHLTPTRNPCIITLSLTLIMWIEIFFVNCHDHMDIKITTFTEKHLNCGRIKGTMQPPYSTDHNSMIRIQCGGSLLPKFWTKF